MSPPRQAAKRPLLFACLVVMVALALVALLPHASRAFAADADVDVEVEAKVEVQVEVARPDEPDVPDPPAITYVAKVLVLDTSGRPISGASVTVQGGSSSQLTGTDGTVRVSGLTKDAPYVVSASKAGYRTFTDRFVCRGLAGEVWIAVLQKQSDTPQPPDNPNTPNIPNTPGGSGGSNGSGGSTPTTTTPVASPANRLSTVDVRDAEAERADDSAQKPDETKEKDSAKSSKSDAKPRSSEGSSEGEGDTEQRVCPWWWLLLVLLALLILFIIILIVRRKKDDEEEEGEDAEADAPAPNAASDPQERRN